MKSLDKYAKEYLISTLKYKLPNINRYRTFEEFCDINNFSDNISEDAIDFYYKYNINPSINRYNIDYTELITENLKSYETQNLINKLNKDFKNDITSIYKINDTEEDKFFPIALEVADNNNLIDANCNISNNELANTDIATQLKSIIKFYGYYITLIDYQQDKYYICVEPNFTKNILNDCRKNGGYLYHVTTKDNKDNILKKGLIPKTGKTIYNGGYRYFPERIYMICLDKKF